MKNINDLINNLTLEEKASLCSGLDFWHLKGIKRLEIPSILVSDGPHGLRKQIDGSSEMGLDKSYPATCFPTAAALASTWNRALIFEVGQALAEECIEEKVSVLLGPGANIKRSPLCGRNFEYFSEDPYLSGEMAKSYINGVQSLGIGTSLKHYAVNNQESQRMKIDAIVDERAMREIYLAGFEIAVKEAQPWTIMGAYNKVNGTYACEHPYLMKQILKSEWQHEGLVVTDWGAMNMRVNGLKAGTEIEMPGTKNDNDRRIVDAVRSGELDESVLDAAVERILHLVKKSQEAISKEFTYDRKQHHDLARKAAGEGAVLLKNESNTLPLPGAVRIALIGNMAKNPRYQGAGSSLTNPSQLDDIYNAFLKITEEDNIVYADGYPKKGFTPDTSMIAEAVEAASSADVVVVCAGLPDVAEAEGYDRAHMDIPDSHNQLIEALAAAHNKVIVVLSNGSPVAMPWADRVQAILEGYLGGQAGASAIVDILYGHVNPSGKLAETFPFEIEDTPAFSYFPGGPKTVEYRESIFVGYRFYDTANKDVRFPFGHGLSYTTFEYSELKINKTKLSDEETLHVRLKVKNSGTVPGKEIVQLYVQPGAPKVFRPRNELKQFAKIDLQPGEIKEIEFALGFRAFAYFNTELQDWHVETGTYRILLGASSRDIRCQKEVYISSSKPDAPIAEKDKLKAYMNFPANAVINREAFEVLIGHEMPENTIQSNTPYTMNSTLSEMNGSFLGRQLNKFIESQIDKRFNDDTDGATAEFVRATVRHMPLRGYLMNEENIFTQDMLEGLLISLNGRFFKGLFAVLKAIRRKRSENK